VFMQGQSGTTFFIYLYVDDLKIISEGVVSAVANYGPNPISATFSLEQLVDGTGGSSETSFPAIVNLLILVPCLGFCCVFLFIGICGVGLAISRKRNSNDMDIGRAYENLRSSQLGNKNSESYLSSNETGNVYSGTVGESDSGMYYSGVAFEVTKGGVKTGSSQGAPAL
jgi:hypothetical protein